MTVSSTGFWPKRWAIAKVAMVAFALAVPTFAAMTDAEARLGGRSSVGSRGSKTFTAPPTTTTAPNAARPMQRTITQPGSPAVNAPAANPAGKGFLNRPGLLGGLAAGFLGAGLLGMLFGGGLLSGLGSFASFFGLLLQIALIVIVARLALSWWRRRNASAYASGPANFDAPGAEQRGGAAGGASGGGALGSMFGGAAAGAGFGAAQPVPVRIEPADYEAFERLLGQIQTAWSNEDREALARLTTPEMESYLVQDLAANAARGVVDRVSDVKLLQGDLAEAWQEGNQQYATVAMRFSLREKTIERASGRVVEGGDETVETTEIWTFLRTPGQDWVLSAIQQTS